MHDEPRLAERFFFDIHAAIGFRGFVQVKLIGISAGIVKQNILTKQMKELCNHLEYVHSVMLPAWYIVSCLKKTRQSPVNANNLPRRCSTPIASLKRDFT